MLTFYDRNGYPTAYTVGGSYIYLFDGKAAAYMYHGIIFTYSGKYLGWYENDWVYDDQGNYMFFTQHTTSGPKVQVPARLPAYGVRSIRPLKSEREIYPDKAPKTGSWSPLSGLEFFQEKQVEFI